MADGDAVSRDVRRPNSEPPDSAYRLHARDLKRSSRRLYHTPDLILLDNSLTGIDAAETLRMLAMCPTTAHIPSSVSFAESGCLSGSFRGSAVKLRNSYSAKLTFS